MTPMLFQKQSDERSKIFKAKTDLATLSVAERKECEAINFFGETKK